MKRRRLALVALVVVFGIGGCTATLYRSDLPAARVETEYAGTPSMFERLAGSRVHVRDEGTGPVLVLLHGTGASLHTWDGWLRVLGDRFRVIRVDLQGFGLTGPNAERDYSVDRQVEVLDALMARRDVERWAVAGNSLGGLIAWRWAAREPERIRHVVLLAPAGAPRDPGTPREKPGFRMIDLARTPGLRELTMRLTPRFMVRRGLEQVYGDPSRLDDETVRRYHRMLLREGNRQALADAMSTRGRGASTSPSEVRQPTLIQWGALDTWIPPSDAERFADALPDAEVIVYPDLGHILMEEAPERTARDALDFLERRGVTGSRPSAE